jgi:hypothetical protein
VKKSLARTSLPMDVRDDPIPIECDAPHVLSELQPSHADEVH